MVARLALAAAAVAMLATPAAAQTWKIDTAHSTASFTVRHMMVSNVHGRFGKLEGTIVYDGKNVASVKADAVIDATTITTDNEKRDAHLKSPDFFDAVNHPRITFKSKRAEAVGKGKFKLIGDLTMRGKTKEVVLDVDGPTDPVTVQNAQRIGATATTTINRQDYGVSWSRTMDGGGYVVSDEVRITLELELIKQ
ncbi:polyisoprenoid-binding protein [Luteitalea sp. TBR-22]|uniref:YceI family protein n=1 Tax=Luteitalea sp. TBR-22 TaxID=2802971 RepID=UPI001AFBEE3A|nr:YceI family protein [Luteitalea sp. TBR-22]BCS31161.1 polyisoprenoid-binding protein [Luteitalea sp. TBR-22]